AHRHRIQAPAHPGGATGAGPDPPPAPRDGLGRPAGHPDPHGGHARPAPPGQARRCGRADRDGPGLRLPLSWRREMIFARRLVAGTVAVLLVTVLVLVVFAVRSLRGVIEGDMGQSLDGEANLVRTALSTESLAWQYI